MLASMICILLVLLILANSISARAWQPAADTPRSRIRGPSSAISRQLVSTIIGPVPSLVNIRGFEYLAPISVGGQQLMVILDTGSSDLWVVSDACRGTDCTGVTQYHPTTPLKLSPHSFSLQYLSGSVAGSIGYETVNIGHYSVNSQALGLANYTSGLAMSTMGHSGILGLSFPMGAAIPTTDGQTFLTNMFANLEEDRRFFAVMLGRDVGGSSFTIGELDSAITNSTDGFTYLDVYPMVSGTYDYWKIPLYAITANDVLIPLSASKVNKARTQIAVLDTGTTLVLGPSAAVKTFWQMVGGARQIAGEWQVRCDHGVTVGFIFESGPSQYTMPFYLDPGDVSWVEGGKNGVWCRGGIQANDDVNSGDWLLGDTFLRNVYVTHHGTQPPRVGLLNMTDPKAALSAFQTERGSDAMPNVQEDTAIRHLGLSTKMEAGIVALVVGLVVGSAIMAIVDIFWRRRLHKTQNVGDGER